MYDIIFTSDGSGPSTTAMSTMSPTFEPSMRWKPLTMNPTQQPTMSPTFEPSMRWKELTMSPTFEPSMRARLLTMKPTLSPTQQPTKEPTLSPTEQPTIDPTMLPISRNETTNGEDTPLIPLGDFSSFTLSIIVFFTVFCVMFTCAASWKIASKSTGSKREGNKPFHSGDTEEGHLHYVDETKVGSSVIHSKIYE